MTGSLPTTNGLKTATMLPESAVKRLYFSFEIAFCRFESENLSKLNELFDRLSW